MNWIKDPVRSTIRAEVQNGVDMQTGRATYANRNFNNVKPDAAVADVAETLVELMSLQKHSVTGYSQTDHSEFYKS